MDLLKALKDLPMTLELLQVSERVGIQPRGTWELQNISIVGGVSSILGNRYYRNVVFDLRGAFSREAA